MKANEAFSEGGSGDVLAGLFVGLLGFEGGSFVAGDEMGWVVGVEEGLACGVGVGSEAGVAMAGVVLSVVQDYDSRFGEDGWRPYFREAAVEVSGAFGEDFYRLASDSFNGRPVDEVGGGGEVDGSFAPVEPVSAVDAGGDKAIVFELGDYASGFVFEGVVLAVGGSEEGGAVLGPVLEVGGRGDADGVCDAVPLCVGEDVALVGIAGRRGRGRRRAREGG